jgi:hypothetical protein
VTTDGVRSGIRRYTSFGVIVSEVESVVSQQTGVSSENLKTRLRKSQPLGYVLNIAMDPVDVWNRRADLIPKEEP